MPIPVAVQTRSTVLYFLGLFAASAASAGLITVAQSPLDVGTDNLELGRMWAVISAAFVFHLSYHATVQKAVTRVSASLIGVALTVIWFCFAAPSWYALAVLVGASGAVAILIRRPQDAVTAAVTAAVIVQVATLSPHNALQQPGLRLLDTVVGTLAGAVAGLAFTALDRSRRVPGEAVHPAETA